MSDWRPIETHPRDDKECLIAILDANGILYIADRGWWEEGETHEEWDEVDDGVRVKLWEDQEEGRFISNHCVIEEPTHWAPLQESDQ